MSRYLYAFDWGSGRFFPGSFASSAPWDTVYAQQVFGRSAASDEADSQMVALFGRPEQPDGYVSINPVEGYFLVQFLGEDGRSSDRCRFGKIEDNQPFNFPDLDAAEVQARHGQVMLTHVKGKAVTATGNTSVSRILRSDGYMRSVIGALSPEIREFEPVAGLDPESLWFAYPSFDDYEELIAAAYRACDELLRL